jgi:hypothetical protein
VSFFIYEIFSFVIDLAELSPDITEERLSSGTGMELDSQRHHESGTIFAQEKLKKNRMLQ